MTKFNPMAAIFVIAVIFLLLALLSSGVPRLTNAQETSEGGTLESLGNKESCAVCVTIQTQVMVLGLANCGDVDCDGKVTTNDARQIFMNLIYGPGDYPLCDLWAADCDGVAGITMNDGRQIFMNLIFGPDDYPLVCGSGF